MARALGCLHLSRIARGSQPRLAERSHLYGRPVHEPTRRRRFLLTALLLLLFWLLTIANLAFNIGGGSSGVAGPVLVALGVVCSAGLLYYAQVGWLRSTRANRQK